MAPREEEGGLMRRTLVFFIRNDYNKKDRGSGGFFWREEFGKIREEER